MIIPSLINSTYKYMYNLVEHNENAVVLLSDNKLHVLWTLIIYVFGVYVHRSFLWLYNMLFHSN